MEMDGIVPAVLAGMSVAAIVLLGMWRMLAHYEKRNDKAHGELRDAITASATRLETRLENRFDRLETRFDQMDERLRNIDQEFGRVEQRLAGLEHVILPPAPAAQ